MPFTASSSLASVPPPQSDLEESSSEKLSLSPDLAREFRRPTGNGLAFMALAIVTMSLAAVGMAALGTGHPSVNLDELREHLHRRPLVKNAVRRHALSKTVAQRQLTGCEQKMDEVSSELLAGVVSKCTVQALSACALSLDSADCKAAVAKLDETEGRDFVRAFKKQVDEIGWACLQHGGSMCRLRMAGAHGWDAASPDCTPRECLGELPAMARQLTEEGGVEVGFECQNASAAIVAS